MGSRGLGCVGVINGYRAIYFSYNRGEGSNIRTSVGHEHTEIGKEGGGYVSLVALRDKSF